MKRLIVVSLMLLPLSVWAGEVTDVGDTTRNALDKQRRGVGAVENRPMLKDVADRTYERYLESFTYPIPERFESTDSFSPGD